jgi:hypothetical protein
MIKKPTEKKPQKEDFTALDTAVSELSEQTAALLGKPTEKAQGKPVLPKKKSSVVSRGKSLDIIVDPKRKTALGSVLKTANTVPAAGSRGQAQPPEQSTEPGFLEDIELDSDEDLSWFSEEIVPEDELQSPTVIKRREGSLIASDQEVVEKEFLKDIEGGPVSRSAAVVKPKDTTIDSGPVDSKAPVVFKDSEDSKAHEEPAASLEGSAEPVAVEDGLPEDTPKTESEVAASPVEPPAYNSGELFANNLVKESKLRGYQPDESQQKPTVFDTNEYHPELHDWSKLDRNDNSKWALLVLLILCGGGFLYFVVLGQPVPFIGAAGF